MYVSAYLSVSDADKDNYVDKDEFIAGGTKLKNRDPMDFPTFLKIAAQFKTLKVGDVCTSSYYAPAKCPAGSSCTYRSGQYTCAGSVRRTTPAAITTWANT